MQDSGSMPTRTLGGHGLPFRQLALCCSALLACTTVRTPVSTIDPTVALRDGRPEPQLELWVESDKRLMADEEERYRSEARAALEQALAGRPQPDGGDLVVVRLQGVTRTPGHRHDQAAATAGLVVGAVVIVALVVVAIVAGGKDGGSHVSVPRGSHGRPSFGAAGASHASRAAPTFSGRSAARVAGALRPPRIGGPSRFPAVPAPGLGHGPRGFPVVPAPGLVPALPGLFHHHGPEVDVGVGLWWAIPLGEPPPYYVYAPAPPEPPEPPPAPEEDAAPGEPPPAPSSAELAVAPPAPLPMEERGFFDGDRLTLQAVVVDRDTGEPLWEKRVRRKADPRDARAVKEAMDALLSEGGWMPPGN